jgi:hypothetical protein
VELSYKTETESLDALVELFYIGLSAIGVEFERGTACRALIHPLAKTSILQKEILLIGCSDST